MSGLREHLLSEQRDSVSSTATPTSDLRRGRGSECRRFEQIRDSSIQADSLEHRRSLVGKGAGSCRRFNDRRITGVEVTELQADEIRTMVGGKQQPIWIFVSIDVWSRLWPSTIVRRRSYRNTLGLFRDVSSRMKLESIPLITTDGFEFYRKVVRRVFGAACLYGQVIKTRRNDRVINVERRRRIGAAWRWKQAWRHSEDSRNLKTSYIEPLNLTIRQGEAFLFSANDPSCTTEATIGRSSPVVTMLLQFREAAPGIEVWTPSQDSRHAGVLDQAADDIPGYFLGNADCLDL